MTPDSAQLVRRTILRTVRRRGVTLFTGKDSELTLRPGVFGSGIVFVDSASGCRIGGVAAAVVRESRRTVLAADPRDPCSVRVQTVEHLLSALAGLGGMGVIDVEVLIDGPEVPIGDGSAQLFVEMLGEAGVADSAPAAARVAAVANTIEVREGEAWIRAEPSLPGRSGMLALEYRLDYGPTCAAIAPQAAILEVPVGEPVPSYDREVGPARTFCLLEEAVAMRKMGMFAHLSPQEMLVIGPDGPVDNTFRFENECARHKLLDLLGDLSLCGRPVSGRVTAFRSGHSLNHEMARRLASL